MPSNLAASVLQDIRADYTNNYDKHEQRASNYGGVALARKQNGDTGSLVSPTLVAQAQNAFGRSIQHMVFDHQDITLQNARTCAFQVSGQTNKYITFNSVTYAFGIEMTPAQYYENEVSYALDFNKQFEAKSLKLIETMDTAVIDLIDTEKNSYWPQEMLDYYAVDGDAFQVPQTEKDDLYNMLQAIASTQDFYSPVDILTNPRHMATVRRHAAQGAGNAENLAFQFAGYNWFESNRVTNRTLKADGTTALNLESTAYAVHPASIGLLTVADPQARAGGQAGAKEWYTIPNAIAGIEQMGVFYQADCGDQSTVLNGTGTGMGWATQVLKESFQFSVDVYYVNVYNSNKAARYQPITKYEILA